MLFCTLFQERHAIVRNKSTQMSPNSSQCKMYHASKLVSAGNSHNVNKKDEQQAGVNALKFLNLYDSTVIEDKTHNKWRI